MTTQSSFENIEMLLPARVHQAHAFAVRSLRGELSDDIAALAVEDSNYTGDDPYQFMLWASSMIWSLPTQSNGDDDGNR